MRDISVNPAQFFHSFTTSSFLIRRNLKASRIRELQRHCISTAAAFVCPGAKMAKHDETTRRGLGCRPTPSASWGRLNGLGDKRRDTYRGNAVDARNDLSQ